ncbi:MAG: hypothetical protein GY909_15945 [Oligoflexia bacterium]|nr:hypothetical protein [Oligoflexia bacterium]
MKIIVILSIMMSLNVFAKTRDITGFQKAKFGMSYKQVKSKFSKLQKAKQGDKKLVRGILTNTRVIGREAALVFDFYNDKLYYVGAMLDLKVNNGKEAMKEYYRVKELLTKAYSNPTADAEQKKSIGSSDITESALMSGDATWQSIWQTSDKKRGIILSLKYYQFKWVISIQYLDEDGNKKASKRMKENMADEL